jgi:rhodanese-related sulfurtransferase
MRGVASSLRFIGRVAIICLLAAANGVADDTIPIHQAPPLPTQAKEMDVKALAKLLKERKDIAILDVRSAEEAKKEGSIPGAKHLDYFNTDFAAMLPQLGINPSKPCMVYCAFGGRARRAAQKLAALGCKEILLPKGGFAAWKKAGEPVEGGKGK